MFETGILRFVAWLLLFIGVTISIVGTYFGGFSLLLAIGYLLGGVILWVLLLGFASLIEGLYSIEKKLGEHALERSRLRQLDNPAPSSDLHRLREHGWDSARYK